MKGANIHENNAAASKGPNATARIVAVGQAMQQIGWHRVSDVTTDMQSAQISFQDSSRRTHHVQVSFPDEFPDAAPMLRADTPSANADTEAALQAWARNTAAGEKYTLADGVALIAARAERHVPLWNALDAIDSRCHVVDPPPPVPRRHTNRKVLLANRCVLSLVLALMPSGNLTITVEVHGPEPAAGKARASATSAAMLVAQGKASPVEALSQAFGDDLLAQSPNESAVEDVSCGVCYAHVLGTSVPDVFCNRCKQAFHTPCLMTWLTAERHARATRGVALTTLSGPCPYCGAELRIAQ